MSANLTADGQRSLPERAGASLAPRLRDGLARFLRQAPFFPGKEQLSRYLNRRLTDPRDECHAIVTTRLVDGCRLRLDLRSEMEWPVFWSGGYDRSLLQLIYRLLPPGALVLDVGANIGLYSVPLGRWLQRSGGQLSAVEPVQRNFDRLVENIALNRLERVVKPLRVALSDRQGTARLQRDLGNRASTGNAALVGTDWGQPNATAPMTTLDHLAAQENLNACHLIKADIEGGELALLRGGEDFIRHCRPLILCELNPFWMDRRGWTFADLVELAHSWDYQLCRASRGRLQAANATPAQIEDVFLSPRQGPMATSLRCR
jgi:FkbM family methyltransferase